MNEIAEMPERPEYRATIERLQHAKRVTATGADYWLAREIFPILGYADWDGFEPLLQKAMIACERVGASLSHHFRQTTVMMKLGKGAQRSGIDFFLSRTGCDLVAMNGDSSKPEIAAAQAYFAVQTRRMERLDAATEDERRLELRERVKTSSRKVSGVAQEAGVKNQAFFHDARYQGLYGMPLRKVKEKKGLKGDEHIFDRAGSMELSANDFQMNLAADALKERGITGETRAIYVNREVAESVRKVIKDSGGRMPEDLPLDVPIAEVKKRLKAAKALPKK
jgi:DNA-damage-inducible protein D